MNSYIDGVREVPQRMSVNWFGKWLNLYFDYKGWSREDINSNGVRKFKINGHLEDDKIEEENNEIDF